MERGDKLICSELELYNAFGDRQEVLELGQRVTLWATRYVGGFRFVELKEHKDLWFQLDAFTPMRRLN